MMNIIHKQKGIGLIEIMVSLVVVAVGILGIAKLQSSVVRSASDANNRAIAATIAQNKIDELRSFAYLSGVSLSPPDSEYAYSQITDNSAVVNVTHTPSGSVTSGTGNGEMGTPGNTAFTLNWYLVGNYYYDSTSPLTVASADNTTELPDFKVVEVAVSWMDIDGSQQEHKIRTVIDGYAPQFTARFGNAAIGANSPIIPYTPEQAPDVVPITVKAGDLKKETSKPLPDVSKKGYSVATSFESVTYNSTLDTVRREDFLTLSCRCGTGTAVNDHVLGRTVWDAENLKLKDEVFDDTYAVSKSVVDDGGGEAQAPECAVCCRDAPDEAGDFKSCRLKRIDGVMRYFDAWKMIAFNIIPASFFDDDGITGMDEPTAQANIDAYSDYVTGLVRNRLALSDVAFDGESADTSFAPNDFQNGAIDHLRFSAGGVSRQIQARAVYMDYPPAEIYDECGSGPCNETDVPLDRVSFFEVNITNLTGWMPDKDQTVDYSTVSSGYDYTVDHDGIKSSDCSSLVSDPARAFVTNDQLVNGCETQLSRGLFDPGSVAASTAVQTIVFESNDGLVNRATTSENTVATEVELITE